MEDTNTKKILTNWEEVFRQGLLTFWIFVVLSESSLSVNELKKRVCKITDMSYNPAEQTLYRSLRNHCKLGLVEFEEIETKGGPKTKIYKLTPKGRVILHAFAKKNIYLFYQANVKKIITGEL